MIVLAIDTANEFGSLALVSDSGTLEEVPLREPGGYSGVLFGEIGGLLTRHALRPRQIDCYSAAAGPGSFTGIRVGLAAAKALADASSRPCFGVSNLEAMARAGSAKRRAVLLDARRGEIYGGVFGAGQQDETVARLADWVTSLPSDIEELLAFDFAPFSAALVGTPLANVTQTLVPRSIAGYIGQITLGRQREGEDGDSATLDANYVRRSDAELLWKGHH